MFHVDAEMRISQLPVVRTTDQLCSGRKYGDFPNAIELLKVATQWSQIIMWLNTGGNVIDEIGHPGERGSHAAELRHYGLNITQIWGQGHSIGNRHTGEGRPRGQVTVFEIGICLFDVFALNRCGI